jgi:hypothetical protein
MVMKHYPPQFKADAVALYRDTGAAPGPGLPTRQARSRPGQLQRVRPQRGQPVAGPAVEEHAGRARPRNFPGYYSRRRISPGGHPPPAGTDRTARAPASRTPR